jgi:C4-dicarboxylate transporter, DctQ subunit
MKDAMARLLRIINRLEDGLLILMLASMVVLAVAQIAWRNFFGAGISWADPLLRTLVLWVALSGAVIASRTDNHIRIDFFTRYIPKTYMTALQRLVFLFSACICALIAWHGARFVQMEYEFSSIAFAGIPSWVTELIIPVGFFLMAMRYILLLFSPPLKD